MQIHLPLFQRWPNNTAMTQYNKTQYTGQLGSLPSDQNLNINHQMNFSFKASETIYLSITRTACIFRRNTDVQMYLSIHLLLHHQINRINRTELSPPRCGSATPATTIKSLINWKIFFIGSENANFTFSFFTLKFWMHKMLVLYVYNKRLPSRSRR